MEKGVFRDSPLQDLGPAAPENPMGVNEPSLGRQMRQASGGLPGSEYGQYFG